MKQMNLMDKYPVNELEISKDETTFQSVEEIITFIKEKVDNHPIATYISVFNHYQHTQSLAENKINKEILDAQNIIFCFGKEIPMPAILAVRPRSIGIVEMDNFFVITFMDAPNAQLHDVMVSWVKSIVNK